MGDAEGTSQVARGHTEEADGGGATGADKEDGGET